MTKRYYIIFNLIVLSAIIYTGVNMIYKITGSRITPVYTDGSVKEQIQDVEQNEKMPLSNFRAITDRLLLGSAEKESEQELDDELKDLEHTQLKLALLGTVSGDKESARAVIEETGKRKQEMYKVGDSVQDAVIDKILRRDVVLKVGDRYEKLTMKETSSEESKRPYGRRYTGRTTRSPQSRMRRGTTITLNRKDIQDSLQDMNQLLTQVRIQPHFKDGAADGLAVSRIKRGSIFSKLGIRNGDIIQQINGKELNSPEEIYGFYEELKSGAQASLQLSRRGRPKTINYRFK